MTASSWPEVLDELEAMVDATRAALASGQIVPDPAWEPPSLGPIPDALRPRAASLLTELHGLAAEVQARRDEVRAALHRGRRTAIFCDRGMALLIDHRL